MANTFFTIGHSTRMIVEFADLLQESGVNLVVDVRSIPRSRTNQQGLPEALAPWQIPAEILYRRVMKLDPNDPAAGLNLGNVLRVQQRTVEAEAAYRWAVLKYCEMQMASMGSTAAEPAAAAKATERS